MEVSINGKNLNTQRRKDKAQRVARDMKIILNSERFKELIVNIPDKYRHGETSKYKTYSGEDFYMHLMGGAEEWNNVVDYEMDLLVDDYHKRWSKVVGYMIPGKPTVWVNTKYFDTMDDMKVGSNFLHEWGHTMGLRHGQSGNIRQSFAYYLNYVYETCYKELILEQDVEEPKGHWVCKRIWYTLWIKKNCRWRVT